MIKGIGVDTTKICDISRIMEEEGLSSSFIRYTFTQAEQLEGAERPQPADYFASRFAAKEAVFKAVARLLPEKTFDLRIVETLNAEDGSPYVNIDGKLRPILDSAGIDVLHISITSEDDRVTAFVISESKRPEENGIN